MADRSIVDSWKPASARRCLFIVLLIGFAAAGPARAAPPAAAPKPPADPEIAQLIKAIEDPAARARLVAALRAAAATPPAPAQPGAAAAPSPAPASAVPHLIDSVGADFLAALSRGVAWFGDVFAEAGRRISSPGASFSALRAHVTSAPFRRQAIDLVIALAATLALGLAAGWLVGRVLGGLRRRIAGRAVPGIMQRLLGSTALFALEIAEIAAFAAVASAVVTGIRPDWVARLCVLAIVNALIAVRLGRAVGRLLLDPLNPKLRLLPIGDEAAAYLTVWLRRLLLVAVWGYSALQVALLLGLAAPAYAVALRLLGLLIAGMAAVFLLQNRRAVAEFLAPPEAGAGAAWAALRRRAADTWHVFALLYLSAAYVVWASEIPGGFAYLARAAVLTLAILVFARGVLALAQRGLARLLHVNRDLLTRYPLIERRTNRYVPVLQYAIDAAVWLAAAIALLAAWQVDIGALFANPVFVAALARLAAALMIVVVAVAIWEATDLAITTYLERKGEDGASLVRSARMRTLLPLMRNIVFVIVSLLAVLTILSQMGVNIAPLLAGAGVVGLAIGFGSQTLVKDVITGAFILFEDTVNVGDVATINGTGGLVEAITIRVIRLRDLQGTVHTIPFGSVTAIANMTKDYSMYLLDVGVAYKENTDRVVEAMREVFDDIAADPAYAKDIIGDLEVLGVDRFAESAVYIRARIKTLPIRQWKVGREYNRRMKLRFDELGIEMPFPHRTIYFGQPEAAAEEPRHVLTARAG